VHSSVSCLVILKTLFKCVDLGLKLNSTVDLEGQSFTPIKIYTSKLTPQLICVFYPSEMPGFEMAQVMMLRMNIILYTYHFMMPL